MAKKRHGGCLLYHSGPQQVAVAAVRRWGREARRLVERFRPLQESRRLEHWLSVHVAEAAFGLGAGQGVLERLVDRHGDRVLLDASVAGIGAAATAAAVAVLAGVVVGGEEDGVDGLEVVLQVLAVGDEARVLADLIEAFGGNRLHGPPHQRVHGEDGVKVLHRQRKQVAVGFGTDARHPLGIR